MTTERYGVPPFDLHLELPTDAMAESHLQQLKASQPGSGWHVWWIRHGRRIYSQIQVPLEHRQTGIDWALRTLIRMQEAGIIPQPYSSGPVPPPVGDTYALF